MLNRPDDPHFLPVWSPTIATDRQRAILFRQFFARLDPHLIPTEGGVSHRFVPK